MVSEMTAPAGSPSARVRIGPISQACRLLLAAIMAWFAVLTIDTGMVRFSQPETLASPGFWFELGVATYYGVYQTAASGFGRRWGTWAVGAFGTLALLAGVVAIVVEDTLWAPPLTSLLYAVVLGFLVLTAIGALISLALGTPGCEFGAVGQLIRRIRGAPELEDAGPMWCIFGLHRLDRWEASRTAHG